MHQTRIRRAYYRIFRVANTPDLGYKESDELTTRRNVPDTVFAFRTSGRSR